MQKTWKFDLELEKNIPKKIIHEIYTNQKESSSFQNGTMLWKVIIGEKYFLYYCM